MDENKEEIIRKMSNIPEKFEKLVKINGEIFSTLNGLQSNYAVGKIELAELDEILNRIIDVYVVKGLDNVEPKAKLERLINIFYARKDNSKKILEKYNNLIDEYMNDDNVNKNELFSRMESIENDYSTEINELEEEYDQALPKIDNLRTELTRIKTNNQTLDDGIGSNHNDNLFDSKSTELTDNLNNAERTFISDNSSVNMLYNEFTSKLEEEKQKIDSLKELISHSENMKRKYYVELQVAEARYNNVLQKLNSMDEKENFSTNVDSDKDKIFLNRIDNRNVDRRDEKLKELDQKLSVATNEKEYLEKNNNDIISDLKLKYLNKKIARIGKKICYISNRQKMVVDFQVVKYYGDMKRELSKIRSHAKIEYEIKNIYGVQDKIADSKSKIQELNEQKHDGNAMDKIATSAKLLATNIEKTKSELELNLLQRKVDLMDTFSKEHPSLEIQNENHRSI